MSAQTPIPQVPVRYRIPVPGGADIFTDDPAAAVLASLQAVSAASLIADHVKPPTIHEPKQQPVAQSDSTTASPKRNGIEKRKAYRIAGHKLTGRFVPILYVLEDHQGQKITRVQISEETGLTPEYVSKGVTALKTEMTDLGIDADQVICREKPLKTAYFWAGPLLRQS